MLKEFNVTGSCFPEEHYMVDTSAKISSIFDMIERGKYFVINRPRQYGKTTTLNMLNRFMKNTDDYFPLNISFEGIGQEGFRDAVVFIDAFVMLLKGGFISSGNEKLITYLNTTPIPDRMDKLGVWIRELVKIAGKKIVLMIDEVDKSSNNQLFLDFLGMLRNKFLKRKDEGEFTFHSVILAGVHDIKTLKLKLRSDSEAKFNSPWNIAVDFNVDLSFSPGEIKTMLADYVKDHQMGFDINLIADKIFHLTSGYPFLVSYLCKIIDEEVLPAHSTGKKKEWDEQDLEKAFQMTLRKSNTNFDSLIQNLENSPDLYEYIFKIVINGADFMYNQHDPLIQFGVLYGMLKEEQGRVRVHNRIYEQIIYNYMASKITSAGAVNFPRPTSSYLDNSGVLDVQIIFRKFQQFMKENYCQKDSDFLERNGRLLFLAFLRPIINGRGFDFKEVQISEERRLDIVVTFDNKKYIIELKTWRGEAYHREGLKQLCAYLDAQHVETGYLLIFDLRKECTAAEPFQTIEMENKTIIAAWV